MTVWSGLQASGRPPPLRPRLPVRGPVRLVGLGWFGFCAFDDGTLELPGVFGGSLSLASSAATRAVSAWTCAQSAWISAFFSAWLRWSRFGSSLTPAFRIDPVVIVSSGMSQPVVSPAGRLVDRVEQLVRRETGKE